MNPKELTPHPFAEAFRDLDADEDAMLGQSMEESGWDPAFPLILYEGKILAGRNRHRWAAVLDIDRIPMKEFHGTNQEARLFVLREQLGRRNLDPSQRAAVVAKHRKELGLTIVEAAKVAGVGASTMEKASSINGRSKEVTDKAIAGEISVHKAAKRIENSIPEQAIEGDDFQIVMDTADKIEAFERALIELATEKLDPLLARPGAEMLAMSLQHRRTDAGGNLRIGLSLVNAMIEICKANRPKERCPDCGGIPGGCQLCGGRRYTTAGELAGRRRGRKAK